MSGRVIPLPVPVKRAAPAGVARAGIVSLSDNLAPGETLDVCRAFITLFRPELEARLLKRRVSEGRSE